MRSRQKKRRHERGRFGFVYTLLVVMALLFVISVSAGLFFKISTIEVVGTVQVKSEDVRAASGLSLGENLLFVNKFSAGRKILDALPYIAEVRIKRNLPGTLVIEVDETFPAAQIERGGLFWLMDNSGKLLGSETLPNSSLPLVTGVELLAPEGGGLIAFPESDRDKQELLLVFLEELSRAGLLEDVSEIDLSKSYDVEFSYLGRLSVSLGMPTDIAYKLSFLRVTGDKLDPDARGKIDLSSAQDKIVRFMPET